MEYLFLGGGWMDELLREAVAPRDFKNEIRSRMRDMATVEGDGWRGEWETVDHLIQQDNAGAAFYEATGSIGRLVEKLEDAGIEGIANLELSFCPFLIYGKEIRKLLRPDGELEELSRPGDDLERVMCAEIINAARRLMASWGADLLGGISLEIIPRLEEDLENLRQLGGFFLGEGELKSMDGESEVELADKLASLATRIAHNLADLYRLNAMSPEVILRFRLLWETVEQLRKEGNAVAAALEALQVFGESLTLAGLRGGELLHRVDLLYERFSDAEALRRAVDHMVCVYRDGEGMLENDQGLIYIEAVRVALGDMGLKLG